MHENWGRPRYKISSVVENSVISGAVSSAWTVSLNVFSLDKHVKYYVLHAG